MHVDDFGSAPFELPVCPNYFDRVGKANTHNGHTCLIKDCLEPICRQAKDLVAIMVYEVLELIYYQQTYSLFSQLMNYSKAVATRSTIAIPKEDHGAVAAFRTSCP
jgi:hypothetical protein